MTDNPTGYDVDRFVLPVDDDLVCPICHGAFRNPMTLLCEHIFCKACIDLCLKKSSTCPVCQLFFEGEVGYWLPPRIVLNILAKLRIRCSKDCNEVFKLEEIENHEEICSKIVCCPIENCNGEQIKSIDLDDHLRKHSTDEIIMAMKNKVIKGDKMVIDQYREDDLKGEVCRLRQNGFFSWLFRYSYQCQRGATDATLQNELLEAINSGNFGLVKSILSSRKVNVDISGDKLILHQAINCKYENIAILLIKCGADTTRICPEGNSVIHRAARENMSEVLELALAFSKLEYLNGKNHQGETALHMAARNGSKGAIKVLLQYGADATLRNKREKTAREVALECRQHDSFRLLAIKNDK